MQAEAYQVLMSNKTANELQQPSEPKAVNQNTMATHTGTEPASASTAAAAALEQAALTTAAAAGRVALPPKPVPVVSPMAQSSKPRGFGGRLQKRAPGAQLLGAVPRQLGEEGTGVQQFISERGALDQHQQQQGREAALEERSYSVEMQDQQRQNQQRTGALEEQVTQQQQQQQQELQSDAGHLQEQQLQQQQDGGEENQQQQSQQEEHIAGQPGQQEQQLLSQEEPHVPSGQPGFLPLRAEEREVLRWAANSTTNAPPAHATRLQYKRATAVEALVSGGLG